MKLNLLVLLVAFLLLTIAFSGCFEENKKTITYAELGKDIEIISPNSSLFNLIPLFTLKSYKEVFVLYIEDKIFNVSYIKINESLSYTVVTFENFTDEHSFPLFFIGNETEEYKVGSTVTIPVHVKAYNITGYDVVWLEEWYWAYYWIDFFNPIPPPEQIFLQGYVTDEGQIVIEHIGGPPLINYTIEAKYVNGPLIENTTYHTQDNPWKVGDSKYILPNLNLTTKDDMVQVSIYRIFDDGNLQMVFNGILIGH